MDIISPTIFFNKNIWIINLIVCFSPPPKKAGRFEFSKNGHYFHEDYSDDEEEYRMSK